MLFSAAIQPQQPVHQPAAAEFVRRLIAGEKPAQQQPAPPRADDLPADLDQRVRLIGEW